MKMPSIIEADEPINPKIVYEDLIKRCKQAKLYTIDCIIEESWTGRAPFSMRIEDGVFSCYVVAKNKRDAFLQVANSLPVIKFLTSQDEND